MVSTRSDALPSTARRWRRFNVDLPVRVIVRKGGHSTVAPGRGTELSRAGMALLAVLCLEPGDSIEIEFQTPSNLQVAGIVRNRRGYRFGLEFISPLPS
jgi:PilZ domain